MNTAATLASQLRQLESPQLDDLINRVTDLLYDEASIRQWYADAAGKGTSLPDRFLRWYLQGHVQRMFGGSDHEAPLQAQAVATPRAGAGALKATLAALARAERPLMVIGSQAVVLSAQADALAEAVTQLGIPVYLSGMARGLLGREHPLQMRHQRRVALREADCVLLAGVPCDFRLDYGRHVRRSATLIAANRSRKDARLNRRPAITALGDAGAFVQDLAHARPPGTKPRIAWIDTLSRRDAEREAEIDTQAAIPGEHVNPVALLRALEREAAADALFVADGGDFVGTASYVLHPRAPLSWLDPGAFGTLGVGAGFALGAAAARPGREIWIVWGDGACGFGLAEFDSFVRHGVPVIAIVGNDAGWTQIAREQVKMLQDDVATVLARSDLPRGGSRLRGRGHPGPAGRRGAAGPAARPRAGGQRPAGAGERVAGRHGLPRGLAVDVVRAPPARGARDGGTRSPTASVAASS